MGSDDEQHIPDDARHTPPESLHHIPDDELLKRKVVVNITSRDQFYEQVYLVKRCLQKAAELGNREALWRLGRISDKEAFGPEKRAAPRTVQEKSDDEEDEEDEEDEGRAAKRVKTA